jgi:hypothetical protein
MTSISHGSGWLIQALVMWGHLYHVTVAGQFKPWSREDIYITWQWLANSNHGHLRTSISWGSGWPIQALVTWGHLYITWQWPANSNLGLVRTSISWGSGWPIPTMVTWGHLYHGAVAGQFKPWSREDIYIMWQWPANSNPGHVRTSISWGSGRPIQTMVTWGHLYHGAVAGQFKPWSPEDIYITWQWPAKSNHDHVRISISCWSEWPNQTLIMRCHLMNTVHVAVASQTKPWSHGGGYHTLVM